MAWEPELGVGPGLTASSASELGGSSLHLLVVRCGAILILLTLFKSIPFDTTREQNALHPRPPVAAAAAGAGVQPAGKYFGDFYFFGFKSLMNLAVRAADK